MVGNRQSSTLFGSKSILVRQTTALTKSTMDSEDLFSDIGIVDLINFKLQVMKSDSDLTKS